MRLCGCDADDDVMAASRLCPLKVDKYDRCVSLLRVVDAMQGVRWLGNWILGNLGIK
jgi:hypothetical protein